MPSPLSNDVEYTGICVFKMSETDVLKIYIAFVIKVLKVCHIYNKTYKNVLVLLLWLNLVASERRHSLEIKRYLV